jgi:DNA-binding MarR family transcriptional regulator
MASTNPYASIAGRYLRALSRLREVHPDMTLLQAQFLFFVASNPGCTQRRVYEALDTTDSNAARTLAILSEYGGRNVEALNLVSMNVNPNDRREKLLDLTNKGKRLMDDLVSYERS